MFMVTLFSSGTDAGDAQWVKLFHLLINPLPEVPVILSGFASVWTNVYRW